MSRSTAPLLRDSEKAFDTVWYDGLICKLKDHNFSTFIINIIDSFLPNMTFKVKVGRDFSKAKHILAGIRQGYILGPTLYITYSNKIPANKNTKVAKSQETSSIKNDITTSTPLCCTSMERHDHPCGRGWTSKSSKPMPTHGVRGRLQYQNISTVQLGPSETYKREVIQEQANTFYQNLGLKALECT